MGKKISIFVNIISIILLLFYFVPRIMLYTAKEESLNNYIKEYFDNCYDFLLVSTKLDKDYIDSKITNEKDVLEILNTISDLKVKKFSRTYTFNPYNREIYGFRVIAKNENSTTLHMNVYVYENNYIKITTYKTFNNKDSKEYNFKIPNLNNYEIFDNILDKIKNTN
jgi:hypothetical protein